MWFLVEVFVVELMKVRRYLIRRLVVGCEFLCGIMCDVMCFGFFVRLDFKSWIFVFVVVWGFI